MSSSSAASAGSAVRLKRLGQMRDSTDRDLIILNAIGDNERLTQRHLARELGMAVSLANLYLRRLALKGFIRIINVRPNRLRYLLTPKGVAEKTHLTYTCMSRTFERYREARKSLREALRPLSEDGHKRIAFYGTGEAAEVAYLCLKETGLDLSAVFDAASRRMVPGGARPGSGRACSKGLRPDCSHVLRQPRGDGGESSGVASVRGLARADCDAAKVKYESTFQMRNTAASREPRRQEKAYEGTRVRRNPENAECEVRNAE